MRWIAAYIIFILVMIGCEWQRECMTLNEIKTKKMAWIESNAAQMCQVGNRASSYNECFDMAKKRLISYFTCEAEAYDLPLPDKNHR